ncbi:hypothetical protein [Bosea sp. BK604]|uniref:hypothetical protein n=1 Tax=Bosea sp. BK604 TaxID=2512180 RepID=UPI00104B67D5|nr:hypothetical protein [Bosea sp. BK604]TCR64676.1 hypothetical protein EV560_106141 [Bosea sp. BK604]
MNTWAAPGVRCVCIREGWDDFVQFGDSVIPVRVPMHNEVLTIRDMKIGADADSICGDDDALYLGFWEIDLVQADGSLKACIRWDAAFFRPLDEPKTDIAVFTQLLEPAKRELVPADDR